MEETNPERILPTKRNLAEAPGVVTPGPVLSPMGMPMSPQLPERSVIPGDRGQYDEARFLPAEPVMPAEPFGQLEPMVPGEFVPVAAHVVQPLEPVRSTEYFMPAEARPLEPMVPVEHVTTERYGVPSEPFTYGESRTLPALEPSTGVLQPDDHCCRCCGNVHDLPQGQLLPRGETIPAGDPLPAVGVSGWEPGRLEPAIPDQSVEPQSGMRIPGRIIEPGERTPRGEHARGENREDAVTKPDDECGDRDRGEHAPGENTEGVVTEPGERLPRGEHVPGENTEGVTEPGKRLLPRGEQAPGEDTEGVVTEPEVPCACCGKVHPGAVRPGELMERLSPYQPALERHLNQNAAPDEPLLAGRVTPGELLTPTKPGTPVTPATPATAVLPFSSATAGVPATPAIPANAVELPQEAEPKQFMRSVKPHEALTRGQAVPGPLLMPQQPATPQQIANPPIYTPAQSQPTQPPVTPVTTTNPGGGNPFSFSNVPGQTGNVPKNGNVGPDPNVKFDEASYNQLAGEIDNVRTTLRKAYEYDAVKLDDTLLLQPGKQHWTPAVNLVTWGTSFGGTVESTAKDLSKTLKTFHTALEKGKAVFKETDDLAAYDASMFTSEYPGFGGGLPGA